MQKKCRMSAKNAWHNKLVGLPFHCHPPSLAPTTASPSRDKAAGLSGGSRSCLWPRKSCIKSTTFSGLLMRKLLSCRSSPSIRSPASSPASRTLCISMRAAIDAPSRSITRDLGLKAVKNARPAKVAGNYLKMY